MAFTDVEQRVASARAIASGYYLEGLAVDGARNLIWYSDVMGGGVHGVTPDGQPVQTLNPDRRWTGGILINSCGAVLSSGVCGIMWNDPDSGASGWLVDTIDDAPINGINEMAPDGAGGIIFGTVDLDHVIRGETPRPSALYRLSATGQLNLLSDGIGFSNGLAYDPDRRQLYCNDTFTGTFAFDVRADWTLTNKTRLLAKPDADGMALDAEGNLWITGFSSSHFERLGPDGTPLDRIDTPAKAVTQLRFGGNDRCDCYFTAVTADGGATIKDGGEIGTQQSILYRARVTTPGKVIAATRFALP